MAAVQVFFRIFHNLFGDSWLFCLFLARPAAGTASYLVGVRSRVVRAEPDVHPYFLPQRSDLQRLKRNTESGRTAAAVKETPGAGNRLVLWVTGALLIVTILAGYSFFHRPVKLTAKDTIVLADFINSTGDPIFDDALKTATTVSLRQSPFLNVVSDDKVAATLKLMMRSPDTKLTPELVRELCQRAGSKSYIVGSIASLGSQYVVGLKAVNCQSGDVLAQEQATAATKENVLNTLGETASTVSLRQSIPRSRSSQLRATREDSCFDAQWPFRFHLASQHLPRADVPPIRNAQRTQASHGLRYGTRHTPNRDD